MKEKREKLCTSCETKYTVTWDINEQDLEPLTCPFCGFEVDEEITDEVWSTDDGVEDDSWN